MKIASAISLSINSSRRRATSENDSSGCLASCSDVAAIHLPLLVDNNDSGAVRSCSPHDDYFAAVADVRKNRNLFRHYVATTTCIVIVSDHHRS